MIRDLLGRPLKNLRLSVTDRCNLRCSYCMPEAEYVWLPRHDILQFEEMSVLIDVFARAGVDRVRLTGGEPLLRRDLPELIRMIADKPAIRDLALTTNGVMLADHARGLRLAGLHRLTVSLDTLRADRFQAMTRFDSLAQVLGGHRRGRQPLRRREARRGDHPWHERGRARTAGRVRQTRSAPNFASSSIWMWAARPSGRASG